MLPMLQVTVCVVVIIAQISSVQPQDIQNTAICPPTAWITCGTNPPNPLVCSGSDAYCCWVTSPDEQSEFHESPTSHWISNTFHPTRDYVTYTLGLDRSFDPDATEAVMDIEYDRLTRTVTRLTCSYVQQKFCSATAETPNNPRVIFTLTSTSPFRYMVPPAFIDYVQMTVDGVGKNACDCENVLVLKNEDRYRCCLWKAGLPIGQTDPKVALKRTLSCKAPGTHITDDVACSRVIREESQCGDTGGCYCRLEYAPHISTNNREPWDCGGCCGQLTGDYGIDLADRRNSTRFQCLANLFNTAPTRNYCTSQFQFPSIRSNVTSAANLDILEQFYSSIFVVFLLFLVIHFLV